MTGRKTKMYEGTLNSSTFLFYCFRQESVLQLLSPMKGLFLQGEVTVFYTGLVPCYTLTHIMFLYRL